MSVSYSTLVVTLKKRALQSPGATDDLARCFDVRSQYHFSESCLALAEKLSIDLSVIFSDSIPLPQKQIFRMTGFINALATGILGDFDYTHARILCAMRLAGAYDLTTGALTALAANERKTESNLRGISSSAVNRMFSQSHRMSTVKTKVSNMTGKNGFSQVTGMTWATPGEHDHTIMLNHDHAAIKMFFKVIDGASIGQIDAMNEKGAKAG